MAREERMDGGREGGREGRKEGRHSSLHTVYSNRLFVPASLLPLERWQRRRTRGMKGGRTRSNQESTSAQAT
jgi:hypothetical protein